MADNPRTMQRIILWAALAALGSLTVLSIVGAHLGGEDPAEKAARLFNSAPMVMYWFLLAGVLLSGLLSFPRLFRSPGPLAAHLGALLILIGAMAGSERMNAMSHRLWGSQTIRTGVMAVRLGEATNLVLDKSTGRGANLPFQLRLESFAIEYHPLAKTEWRLGVQWEPSAQEEESEPRQAWIEWAVGKEAAVPFTGARIKVLQYLPHARPVYDANASPALEIVRPDGSSLLLPAKVGAEALLPEANVTVRIVHVFSHLMVVGKNEVMDVPDAPGPPALALQFEPGDPNEHTFVWEQGVMGHSARPRSLPMRYVLPRIVGARQADQGPPAMEVLLSAGPLQRRHWLVPAPGRREAGLPLEEFTPPALQTGHRHVTLHLLPPAAMPKAYRSRLTVLKDGIEVAAQVVEVNNPLHYGGYHFHQRDYDHERERYTVLGVTSDSGLYVVYAGFGLMLLGVCWVLWARPADKGPAAPEQAVYRVVRLGFPLLTLGLLLGAVWGKRAWGDYWGWDPKELWSLASWLVFLGYLHWRYVYGRRYPRANAGLAVAGLLAIVATLFIVNTGMHSYSESGWGMHVKRTLLGFLIVGAMGAYVASAIALALKSRTIGTAFFVVGFLLALAAVIKRWGDVDHLPLQNLFEVFLFLGMLALPMSLFCRLYLRVGGEVLDAVLGFLVLLPAAFVFTAERQQLPPALQSWLFAPHVGAYMVAYVVLAKAGLLALGQLFRRPAALQAQP